MTKFQGRRFINIAIPIIILILLVLTIALRTDSELRFYIISITTLSIFALTIVALTIYKIFVDNKAQNREYKIFHEKITAKDKKSVTFTNDYGKTRIVKGTEFETAKIGDEYFVVYWKNDEGQCTKVWQSITKEAFFGDKSGFNTLKNKGYRFPEKQTKVFVKTKWVWITLDKVIDILYWIFTILSLFVLTTGNVGAASVFGILYLITRFIKTADVVQDNIQEKCEQLANGEYLVIHEKIVKKTFNKIFLENDVGDIRTVNKFNIKNIKFTIGHIDDEFYTAYIGEFEEKDDLRRSWKTITKKQFDSKK